MSKEQQREDEISQTRNDDTAVRPKAAREAAEARRKQKEIVRFVLRAIQTGDTRSLSKQLRQAGVSEGSDVWKKAWEIYRDSLRRK
jgi:hypothetical protein